MKPAPLSTSGVQILSSMKEIKGCSSGPSDPMEAYEKPGFRMCSFVNTFVHTDTGPVPIVKSKLGIDDLFSTAYVRCGIHRHTYTVAPGLYGIGNPGKDSEVLVTANFKLTFDSLRQQLGATDAWILVLNTQGVNVWCAAGKGTFSTRELVRQIQSVCLEKIVNHHRVIVPQLGATGVSATAVREQSGFKVVYGPIRASDIPAFLANGRRADKAMRAVTFTAYERFILTPVEIKIVLKPALITALLVFFLSGIGPGIFSFTSALDRGMTASWALVAGILSGAFVTPVLLPYIPFRAFALKGILMGSILALFPAARVFSGIGGAAEALALFLFCITVSSYLAMNFTGATPFTSPSGVEKEMKHYIPVQLAGLLMSTGVWIYAAF